jgi:hypothetical protein
MYLQREYLLFLKKQCGSKVIAVRSDRGGEYVNKTFQAFFASKGVPHQRTAPYTPQQNGAAERLNRTLMEKARPMLVESGLPLKLWIEAVATANYLRNRSPVAGSKKTPFETFFRRRSDVKHLRTFGATAYALKPDKDVRKLDAKGVKGILVGYEGAAYRIWLPADDKTIVRRDVIVNEAERYPHVVREVQAEMLIPLDDEIIEQKDAAAMQEALKSDNEEDWQRAINEEIKSL